MLVEGKHFLCQHKRSMFAGYHCVPKVLGMQLFVICRWRCGVQIMAFYEDTVNMCLRMLLLERLRRSLPSDSRWCSFTLVTIENIES